MTVWCVLKDAFLVTLVAMTLSGYKPRDGINTSRISLIIILIVLGAITNL